MDHEKKLAFIAKMTKMGLDHVAHLDSGGAIIPSVPQAPGVSGPGAAPGAPNTNVDSGPIGALNGLLGLGNKFQATQAPIQAGTNAGQINNAYTGANAGVNAAGNLVNETAPGVSAGLSEQGVLADQLATRAAGNGPSPAEAALAASTGQNVNTTAANIAGARGSTGNVGLLTRNAANAGANINENAAAAAATLKAQEQIAAQQAAAGLASTRINQGAGAITNVNQAAQGEQGILQGANTAFNNANVSSASNLNNVNEAAASSNQKANQDTLGGILSGVSGFLGLAKGGMVRMDSGGNVLDANARKHIAPENFALPGGRYPIQDVAHARNALARVSQNGTPAEKAKVKAAVHKKYPELSGKKMAKGGEVTTPQTPSAPPPNPDARKGISDAFNGAMGLSGKTYALGGKVKDGYFAGRQMAMGGCYADGGYAAPSPLVVNPGQSTSFVAQWLNSPNISAGAPTTEQFRPDSQSPSSLSGAAGDLGETLRDRTRGDSGATGDFQGDIANAPSPIPSGSMPLPPALAQVGQLASGGRIDYRSGGGVKAGSSKEKAEVSGDSLKNDKVPAMLSEGEEVIDRETLADPGTIGKMARAVAAHIAKKNKGKRQ